MCVTINNQDLQKTFKGFRMFFVGLSNRNERKIRVRTEYEFLTISVYNDGQWLTHKIKLVEKKGVIDFVSSWSVFLNVKPKTQKGTTKLRQLDIATLEVSSDCTEKKNISGNIPKSWPDESIFPCGLTPFDKEFANKLSKAFSFIDLDGSRAPLRGVLLEPDWLIGADGRRLARFSHHLPIKKSVILEYNKVIEKELLNAKGNLSVNTREKQYCLETNAWKYTGKLIDGNYPNYRQALVTLGSLGNLLAFSQEDADSLTQRLKDRKPEPLSNTDPVHLVIDGNTLTAVHNDGNEPVVIEIVNTKIVCEQKEHIISIERSILLEVFQVGFTKISFNLGNGPFMATGDTTDNELTFMPIITQDEVKEGIKRTVEHWHEPSEEISKQESDSHNQPQNQQKETKKMEKENAQQGNPVKTETNGFKVVSEEKSVETFEDLIELSTELKHAFGELKDRINAFPSHIRAVSRNVKAKEREFESARKAIKELQKVSGF